MEVPTKDEFTALQERVKVLESTCAKLMQQAEQEKPVKWLSVEEAATYFIKDGQPIPYRTMLNYVHTWIENGTLEQGVNLLTIGKQLYISQRFFCEGTKSQKLKIA